MRDTGNKLFFVALSGEAMAKLHDAERFRSSEVLTEPELLEKLDPSIGPMYVAMAPEEFMLKPSATVLLIPEFVYLDALDPAMIQ